MTLLAESFFSSQWFMIIILVVVIGLLMLLNYSRGKKEQEYREDLNSKIVKGAKVKTSTGIYGTVISVRSTTDGKIVLLETGEGKNMSTMEIHINAIYGVDDKEDLVLDSEGNEVTLAELKQQQLDKLNEVNEEKKEQAENSADPVETDASVETAEKVDAPKPKRTRKTKSE